MSRIVSNSRLRPAAPKRKREPVPEDPKKWRIAWFDEVPKGHSAQLVFCGILPLEFDSEEEAKNLARAQTRVAGGMLVSKPKKARAGFGIEAPRQLRKFYNVLDASIVAKADSSCLKPKRLVYTEMHDPDYGTPHFRPR